jgi:hypothetical protein
MANPNWLRFGGDWVGMTGITVPISSKSLYVKRCPAGMISPLLIVPGSPTVPGGAGRSELGTNAGCWPLPTTSPVEKYVPTGSKRKAFQRICQKPSTDRLLVAPMLNEAIGAGRKISFSCTPGLCTRVKSIALMTLMPP